MKQFDDILQLPYLDSLSVLNPLKGQAEDPTNGQDKIDIRSMVDYYYKVSYDRRISSNSKTN